jgi:hypothetical protein
MQAKYEGNEGYTIQGKKTKIDFPSPELPGAGSRGRNTFQFPLSRFLSTPPAHHCILHWFSAKNITAAMILSIPESCQFLNLFVDNQGINPVIRGVIIS